MKKISIYIIFALLGLASCKKSFLDQSPLSQGNAAGFYKTQTDFEQALNGAYQGLRASISLGTGTSYVTAPWLMGEMRSDNTFYDYKASDRAVVNVYRENIDNFLDDKFNTETAGMWNNNYVVISRANAILDRIGGVTLADSVKSRFTGEAEFLRALSYFYLVRYYGGVPLYLHAVQNQTQAFLARSSADSVYAQIIADATDAVQKLNPPAFPQVGRATKGSALTLLADVYMTQKKYADAEATLEKVTQMGYQLQTDYAAAFATNNKNSKESIFEIQYSMAILGQESSFIYWYIPRMANCTIVTGDIANTITTYGGWNTPTQDLIGAYESGDKRLDASIAVVEGTWSSSSDFTPSAVKSIVGYTPSPGKAGRPFNKKYLHAHTLPQKTDDNWPVYRYAEVLLLLAESLNEQGRTADALPWVNQVRGRAGLAPLTSTDQTVLRDSILHERRVELAFENKRWLDLVRTGNAITVMNAQGDILRPANDYLSPNSYKLTTDRLLFPIPYSETQLNTKLTQNHGYE